MSRSLDEYDDYTEIFTVDIVASGDEEDSVQSWLSPDSAPKASEDTSSDSSDYFDVKFTKLSGATAVKSRRL